MKQIFYTLLFSSLVFSCNQRTTEHEDIDRLSEISQMCSYQEQMEVGRNYILFDTLQKLITDSSSVMDIRKVRKETLKLLDTIQAYRYMIIHETGGIKDHISNLVGQDDTMYINKVFIKPNGPAENLEQTLINYSNFIRNAGLQIDDIALSGDKNPLYKRDERFKGKGFGYTYFKNATALEADIVLKLISTEVLRIEKEYYESKLIKNVM